MRWYYLMYGNICTSSAVGIIGSVSCFLRTLPGCRTTHPSGRYSLTFRATPAIGPAIVVTRSPLAVGRTGYRSSKGTIFVSRLSLTCALSPNTPLNSRTSFGFCETYSFNLVLWILSWSSQCTGRWTLGVAEFGFQASSQLLESTALGIGVVLRIGIVLWTIDNPDAKGIVLYMPLSGFLIGIILISSLDLKQWLVQFTHLI